MRRADAPSKSSAASFTKPPSTGLYIALIAAAVIGCYSNALSGPFVFDDRTAIVENSSIRSFAEALRQTRNLPTSGRPIAALSFAANYSVGELEVRGYHLTNIGIHVCAALLLFGVARRTLLLARMAAVRRGAEVGVAFAIALIWAVHPLNTEAVDYLTQRTESLMALMFVATLYASIRALDPPAQGRWQSAAVAACALGMASKESMVVAPLMVMLYDRIFVFSDTREAVRQRWRLYGGLGLTWLVLAWLVIPGPRSGSAGFGAGVETWTYVLNQTVMVVRYLRLAVWPIGLVVNYGRPVALSFFEVWPQAVAVSALLIGTLLTLVRWPRLGFLAAWFVVTLAPSSSIVPIATEVGAERRMYLPLMAFAACAVIAVYRLAGFKRFASPVAAGATVMATATVLAAGTVARNHEYATPLILAQTSLARWPSPVAHAMVGTELAALGRDAEAVNELRAAAAVDPQARYNLGITLVNVRDDEGAIRELEAFARDYPLREEVPAARRALGTVFAREGKWAEAVGQYRRVLAMTPADQATRRLLVSALVDQGNALGNAGRFADAAVSFRQASELDPTNAIAGRGLALALEDLANAQAAAPAVRRPAPVK